jgi:hypothetical protein
MARKILLKENGLDSSVAPLGYKLIGYDDVTFSEKQSDGSVVTIGGGSSSGSNFFLGKIADPIGPSITIGQLNETIVGDYLITANSLSGIGFPSWSVVLDFSTDQWGDMNGIIKIYITEEQGNIDGLTPLYQETLEAAMYAQRSQGLYTGYGAIPFPADVSGIEYNGDTIRVIYYDNVAYRYYVSDFENFDVSKDLYLTVTVEFTEDALNPNLTVGVKTLQILILPFK